MKRNKNGKGFETTIPMLGRYKKPRFLKGRGVTRYSAPDGLGNVGTFWVASIQAEGHTRIVKFAVSRLGETRAEATARETRTKWEKDAV